MIRYTKPTWWQLYLSCILLLALLFAQRGLRVSAGWHELIELGLVIVLMVPMVWWTRRNARALDDEAIEHEVKQRAAARHVQLTPIQTRYLVALARRTRKDEHDQC